MKRLKLFIAALALLGGGSLAYAQTDVTSTYLTNADFETSPTFDGTSLGSSGNNATPTTGSTLLSGAVNVYEVSGWTLMTTEKSDFARTFTMPYNTTLYVKSNGSNGGQAVAAPTNGSSITESNNYLLFVEANWCNQALLGVKQTATLPAGIYTLTFDTYVTTNKDYGTSRCGISYGSTTNYKWPSALNTWTNNQIDFTLTEETEVTFSFGYLKNSNQGGGKSPFLFVDNVKLLSTPFATADDYTALNTAISAVESKAWGFDANEYAPYNYAAVLQALAEAEAIDQTANNSQATVLALTATMNGATWTANTEEVNAFYDGTFSAAASVTGNTCPTGWHGSDSHYTDGYWVRLMYSDGTSNIGLRHFSNGCAMMAKSTPRYGLDLGYTMPLNAETYYKLSFDFAGWGGGNTGLKTTIVITDGSDNPVTVNPAQTEGQNQNGHSDQDAWKTYTGMFKTGEAGNYKLLLSKTEGDGSGYQITYGNMVLKTLTVAEATAYYNSVLDAIDDDYEADVPGGTEKTNFKSAIDASIEGKTVAEIMEATANLNTLHDTYVAAKPAYNKFYTEKARALTIGVQEANITIVPTLASEVQNALNALYVLEDAAATANYTIDVTDIFGTWTTQNTSTNSGQHWSGDGRSYIDKKDANGFTMSVSNTVTLPAGDYVFKAAARAAAGGVWDDALTMQVTGQSNAIFNPQGDTGKGIDTSGAANYGDGTFANDDAGRGWEWRFIPFTLTAETEVTMKIEAIVKGGNWASFSDITLLTTEENTTICKQLWESAKDAAEAAINNSDYNNVTGNERTDLSEAITAAETEPTTATDYKSQETALRNATTAFIAAKASYDTFVAVKSAEYTNNLPYASATKFAAIATAQAEDATSAADADAKTAAINSAYRKYVESNALAEGVDGAVDKTDLISNPNFAGVTISGTAAGAWTFDQTGGNANIYSNESFTDGNGNSNYSYFDYYNGSNNNQNLHQVIEDLAPGRYILTATGRGHSNFNNNLQLYVVGKGSVYIPAIGNTGGVFDGGWNDVTVEFIQTETSDVTIGAKTDNNKSQWWGVTRFRLVKLSDVITENATTAPEACEYANVILERTLSSEYWNTFSVPFDMEIPLGWTVKEFDSSAGNVINFKNAESIVAGNPYLVKPNSDVTEPMVFNGVTVSPETVTKGTGDYKFAAQIYNKSLPTDGSIAYLATDGSIKKLTSGSIKGLRAYFIIPANSTGARIAFTDGSQTGIEDSFVETENDNRVYDLQGRQVKAVKKGIYVVNGKKVIK